jgi:hypothetical protein
MKASFMLLCCVPAETETEALSDCLELGQFGVREVSIRALKGACMELDMQNHQQHHMQDTSMRQACLTLLV